MRGSTVAAVVLFAAFAGSIHGRLLQQTNYASAVSVSGGQGPYGNCGATQTAGNAAAYASGPPCGAVIIPAPPPLAGCPATTVTVEWQLPSPGQGYKPLQLCPGSTVAFKWNTGKSDLTYGLYQVPSATCNVTATSPNVKLIISPASSPNPAGIVSATLNAPGSYFFSDINNCAKGQLQSVVISTTQSTASPAQAQAATAAAGKK